MMKRILILGVIVVLILIRASSAATNISACGTYSGDTDYVLNQSITSNSGSCITINGNNVIIDGAGFNLTSDCSGTDDIAFSATNRNNVTVKNVIISRFYRGFLISGNSTTVQNATIINLNNRGGIDSVGGNATLTGNNISFTCAGSPVGIRASSTAAGAIIANNTISTVFSGILFTGNAGANITVVNNTLTGTTRGLEMDNSHNLSLIENNLSSNSFHIWFANGASNNYVIRNNVTATGTEYSFYVSNGDNNFIISNTVVTTYYGVYSLSGSTGNNFTSNSFISSGNLAVFLISSNNHWFYNNFIDGTDAGLKADASTNLTFLGNTFNGSTNGAYLNLTNGSVIQGNIVEKNLDAGIYLLSTTGNNISHNIVRNNTRTTNTTYGIYLENSKNITLENNTVYYNNRYGIYLHDSNTSLLLNNNVSFNNEFGVHMVLAFNNTLSGGDYFQNNLSGIAGTSTGISISTGSRYNLVNNATVTKNRIGIGTGGADNNTIANSYTHDNYLAGIYLTTGSDYNTIVNNSMIDNSQYGIEIKDDSAGNEIRNNTVSGNIRGIWLLGRQNHSIVEQNNITQNSYGGILDWDGFNNTMRHNVIQNNPENGIQLLSSDGAIVYNNTITGNQKGIYFGNGTESLVTLDTDGGPANNNFVYSNNVSSNTYGIYFDDGDNNTIQDMNVSSVTTDVTLNEGAINNVLLNVSYSTESVVLGNFTRKWYFKVFVNNSAGSPINATNITITNTQGQIVTSSLTNQSGYISTYNISDYLSNSSKTYYSNYSVTANHSNYNSALQQFNATRENNNLNFYFTLSDTTFPLIEFGAQTSDDNVNVSADFIFVNVSVTETNEANLTFRLYNTTDVVNTTTFTDGTRSINFTSLPNGIYYYNVTVSDNSSNQNSTATRTSVLDTEYPAVYLTTPANASTWTSSSTVDFVFNVTDVAINNCSLYINGSLIQTDNTIVVGTAQTMSTSLGDGQHNWSVGCTDYLNNFNMSSNNYSLTVDVTADEESTSESSGTQTLSATAAQLKEGYTRNILERGRVNMIIKNESHRMVVTKIYVDKATLVVSSEPQTLNISEGSTEKVDLNGDGFYDLSIFLEDIVQRYAKLTLKEIHEEISAESEPAGPEEETELEGAAIGDEASKSRVWKFVLLALIILAIVIIIVVFFNRGKRRAPRYNPRR